jgi:hypothetical protein
LPDPVAGETYEINPVGVPPTARWSGRIINLQQPTPAGKSVEAPDAAEKEN